MEKHNDYTIQRMATELANMHFRMRASQDHLSDLENKDASDSLIDTWVGIYNRDKAAWTGALELCNNLGFNYDNPNTLFGSVYAGEYDRLQEEWEGA